jgi:hypothetical protein
MYHYNPEFLPFRVIDLKFQRGRRILVRHWSSRQRRLVTP